MAAIRAVLAGVGVFPLVALVCVVESPPSLLLAGLPSGAITGYLVGSLLGGLVYGAVTGTAVAALFLAASYGLIWSVGASQTYPGVGFAVVGLAAIAVLLAVESVVAGALLGLLRRG